MVMRQTPWLTTASVLILTLLATPAFAQKIRSYTDSAESQYGTDGGVSIPGGPRAAAAPAADPAAPPVEGAEGDESSQYSEVVRFQGGRSANVPASQLDLKPEEMYRGVIPGTRDSVEQFEKNQKQTGPNQLTWVGFQPRDASTRVFFQTTREPNYTMSTEGSTIIVTFFDTKLAAKNNGRFIDTSFFNRNVTRIESKKKGKNVEVRISMKEAERPQVNATDRFVYFEFAPEKKQTETTSKSPSARALDE